MRAKGYVVGHDTKNGELVWTVKVKDLESLQNGRKLAVASLYPGTMLTKPGVDITFDIQPVGETGDIKAVDVQLVEKVVVTVQQDPSTEVPSSINFVVMQDGTRVWSVYTEHDNLKDAMSDPWMASMRNNVLTFVKLNPESFKVNDVGNFGAEEESFFSGLKAEMAKSSACHNTLGVIVTVAFMFGWKIGKKETTTTTNPEGLEKKVTGK